MVSSYCWKDRRGRVKGLLIYRWSSTTYVHFYITFPPSNSLLSFNPSKPCNGSFRARLGWIVGNIVSYSSQDPSRPQLALGMAYTHDSHNTIWRISLTCPKSKSYAIKEPLARNTNWLLLKLPQLKINLAIKRSH